MRYPASELTPERRAADADRLSAEQFDILVVGGGVTGAGAALDAASRGLRTALVESVDWAAGTSSRSSKLVHGGLRYLQRLDFHLVYEALRERSLLLGKLAPHLVRPVPILYPLHVPVVERLTVGAGVGLYDLMGAAFPAGGAAGRLPHHRHLSRRQALAMTPALRPDRLSGAVLYYDGQVDDARFVAELVRTAAAYGAVPLNRARVTALVKEGGRVVGARLWDTETGSGREVRARVVLSATGVWSEDTEALAGAGRGVRVKPSKGVHLVVPADRVSSEVGLITRTPTSVLFVLPWGRYWVIGTTDTDWPYDKAVPLATAADLDYVLGQLNSVLRRPLSRADVVGVYAGLRPLVAGEGVVRGPGEERKASSGGAGGAGAGTGGNSAISREHSVVSPVPGLVVVSGGKYTTYRVMAAQAVDLAVRQAGVHAPVSRTHSLPLLGARHLGQARAEEERARAAGLGAEVFEHLVGRYGGQVGEVLDLLSGDPSLATSLGEAGGSPTRYLRAEVVHAVTHEGARHMDDVMVRRARLAMEEPDGGATVAGEVAALMAGPLGWAADDQRHELDLYLAQADLVGRASQAGDDAAAAALAGFSS